MYIRFHAKKDQVQLSWGDLLSVRRPPFACAVCIHVSITVAKTPGTFLAIAPGTTGRGEPKSGGGTTLGASGTTGRDEPKSGGGTTLGG